MLKKIVNLLNCNKKNVLLPVFITSLVLYYFSVFIDESFFLLKEKEILLNGIATFNLINIATKIDFYWKMLLGGFLIFLVTFLVQNFLIIKDKIFRKSLDIINLLSSFGIILIIHSILSEKLLFSLEFLIYLIVYLIISVLLLPKINKWVYCKSHCLLETSFWSLLNGFALFFIINNLNLYLSEKTFRILFIFPFELSLVSMIIVAFFSKKYRINILKLYYYTGLLWLFVLWGFVNNELLYILNQNNLFYKPLAVLLWGYFTIIILFFLFANNKKDNLTTDDLLKKVYFPLIIIVFSAYAFYKPYISATSDMFELANPSNAIMHTIVYGDLPFVNYLNSHVLSEIFFGFIYTALNGYSTFPDFFIYDFLHHIISYLLSFYILNYITKNHYFSFIFIVFFPFIDIIFCHTFSIALISVFMINKMYNNFNYRNTIFALFILLFIIVWRIDIGYANLIAFLLLIFIIIIIKFEFIKIKIFLISTLSVISFSFILFYLICLIKGVDMFLLIKSIMHYISGNQAHALINTMNLNDKNTAIHYLLFPLFVLFIGLVLLLNLKRLLKVNAIIILSVFFLIVYYFVNFPRGIVRHGFAIAYDYYLTSFIYLIFFLLIFFYLLFKKNKEKYIVLIFSIYMIIVSFKFPDIKGYNNLFETFNLAYMDFKPLIKNDIKINRFINDKDFENENFKEFKYFMDKHFDKEATFIDFSNSPMLYFYTQRKVPSYFSQYMQNTIDDYLQTENIKYLLNFNIPVVVFSNFPNNWFDKTDDVPNTVRYYRIAEYIYKNYIPYDTISKHSIWLRKDITLPKNSNINDSILINPFNNDLMKLPFAEANFSENQLWNQLLFEYKTMDIVKNDNFFTLSLPENIDKSDGNYIIIELKNNVSENQKMKLVLMTDSTANATINFDLLKDEKIAKYAIRISCYYQWYSKNNNKIRLYFFDKIPEIKTVKIFKAI